MRRFLLAATILSIVASGPLPVHAGDREIAEQIIQKLKVHRDAGSLKDFTLDLKVDKGVVLLRGNVREAAQKQSVLAVANGIEGIANIVDEITISPQQQPTAEPAATPALPDTIAAKVVRPKAAVAAAVTEQPAPTPAKPASDNFSFKQALAAATGREPAISRPAAPVIVSEPAMLELPAAWPQVVQAGRPAPWQAMGQIEMVAAEDSETSVETDRAITSSVVAALGTAQRQGRLKGYGVDVNTQDGRVYVTGRASSEQHRQLIGDLARRTPGVVEVIDEIAVYDATGGIPQPIVAEEVQESMPLVPAMPRSEYASNLTPVAVEPVYSPSRSGTPAIAASARSMNVPSQSAGYPMQQGAPLQAMPVNYGSNYGAPCGVNGSPMPMAPYAGGAAAPRYEQPYLPNYAWPGYAAYPNYAAVTYPQQYSPSAWPYIGPFYPYPQVPLGWRKVSLEWDDGWWMLDFTDR